MQLARMFSLRSLARPAKRSRAGTRPFSYDNERRKCFLLSLAYVSRLALLSDIIKKGPMQRTVIIGAFLFMGMAVLSVSSLKFLSKRGGFRSLFRLGSSSATPEILEKTYLLEYSYVSDILEKRTPYRPDHLKLAEGLEKEGIIIAGGATGSPPSGALFILSAAGPEVVEAFVKSDPYHKNGLVTNYNIKLWTVVVGSV